MKRRSATLPAAGPRLVLTLTSKKDGNVRKLEADRIEFGTAGAVVVHQARDGNSETIDLRVESVTEIRMTSRHTGSHEPARDYAVSRGREPGSERRAAG